MNGASAARGRMFHMTSSRQIQHNYQLENDGEHIPYDHRYWTAQICLSGHVQNSGFRVIPAEKYCECGAETIHQCPSCHSNIKGAPRDWPASLDKSPRGCLKCGAAYPWTIAVMEKVAQLINESPLSTVEKEETKADLDSILKNAPNADTAARRTHGRLVRPA